MSRSEIVADIRRRGWAVRWVEATAHPAYACTIGLTALGHPELTVAGRRPAELSSVLDVAATRVRGGRRLRPDRQLHGVLAGAALRVDAVNRVWHEELFSQATDLYRDRVEVLQLVWPDDNGRWPEDELAAETCRLQPRFALLPAEQVDPGWRIYPWPFPVQDIDASALVSRELLRPGHGGQHTRPRQVSRDVDGVWTVGQRDLVSHPLDDLLARFPELRAVADLSLGGSAQL